MRRKHATASVRLQANAWATEDILPAGLSVVTPNARPVSGSTLADAPSVLTESSEALTSLLEDKEVKDEAGEGNGIGDCSPTESNNNEYNMRADEVDDVEVEAL